MGGLTSKTRGFIAPMLPHAPITPSGFASACESKLKSTPNGRRRHHRLAKRVQQGMKRPPSGAMRRHNLFQVKRLEMGHGVGNVTLHRRACQMQAPEHAI